MSGQILDVYWLFKWRFEGIGRWQLLFFEYLKIILKKMSAYGIVYVMYLKLSVVEGGNMAVSYNKLWKLLIDRNMNKTQLCEKAKISTNAMARLGRNEDVRVEVLTKICVELGCTMDEIMEIIPNQ